MKSIVGILFFIFSSFICIGQISPGPLSEAHAHLEGISNCTQCHVLGKSVSSEKCLACHNEISSLVNENRGYHSSWQVREKECFDCHSDHHGRKFDAIHFDEENFDHDLTFYSLEGKHLAIDCRDCHQPDYIIDSEIRNRESTFLGLSEDCASCHEDYHQESLGKDCVSCHDFKAFRPASLFSHDDTAYPLFGQHKDVSCVNCHEKTIKNGKEFQQFVDLKFNDCVACHKDPHRGHIEGHCITCHTEDNFGKFIGKNNFDHNLTGFELKGSHKSIDCFDCHLNNVGPLDIFHDNKGIGQQSCVSCHDDTHNGKFGTNCFKCHKESTFHDLKTMDFFDHTVTDFPLEGKHIDVDCKSCHNNEYLAPLPHNTCASCHDDYHDGEFEDKLPVPDCVECHSLSEGFKVSLFGFEEHSKSEFSLSGAHLATPCFECHLKDERWQFRQIGQVCKDCHENIHEDYIQEKYYPAYDCQICHNEESWKGEHQFDHNLTKWPLTGKHIKVSCSECHLERNLEGELIKQEFKDLGVNCYTCHDNPHESQFEIGGVTDCNRCHVTKDWVPEKFDHNQTNFPLDGKHKNLDCRVCHIPIQENGIETIDYTIEKYACIDCHK